MVYFLEAPAAEQTQVFNPVLQVDDLLSLTVWSADLELAAPFNKTMDLPLATNSGYSQGNPTPNGYLIDKNGNIRIPIVGNIQVAGLSREQACLKIENALLPYLDQSVVDIQIANFKVTVLGEVQNPGTYKIPNERLTILEAIGLAGDLRITGKRQNVKVLRQEAGKTVEYKIDLTKTDWMNSPVYYLQQNDVIYVEPNFTARYESTMAKYITPIVLSATSLVITTLILLRQ